MQDRFSQFGACCLLSSNPLLPLIKWNDFQPITVCGSFDMTDSSELKFQRIGQILDRNADSPSLLRQAYPPCLLTVPCSNNYVISYILVFEGNIL